MPATVAKARPVTCRAITDVPNQTLVQDERDEARARARDDVLQSVQLVGDRPVGDRAADARVPQRLAGGGVVGADAAGGGVEQHVARGREDAGVAAVTRDAP